ncbi:ABC transporter permease [Glycomyces harbinensis]|uniref:Peptide/nickel transport system permease protein/oligopeptide transport system permease protein n=1 Tax=Glycomyces harbinensis TaxID=58114 RepID=A0A1G6U5D7_9ACTN|nr:ABC transporter permease [Glycomyces harbinensis]SDD36600.1 peptide/nickel transport system permease protein/oligopeptide transport system permease protein [Glycomyces harbinensis]
MSELIAPSPSAERQASLWSDAFRAMRKRPDVIIATLVLLIVFAMAAFPRLFTDKDPTVCLGREARLRPDTWFTGDHPLGTDAFGCDFAATLVHGTRPTITLALSVIVVSVVVGLVLGIYAGYYGRWVDGLISRALDVFIVIPMLMGAVLILSLFRGRVSADSLMETIAAPAIALALFGWMEFCRYTRAATLETKNLDYVVAAKCLGASDRRIMFKHILPNAIVPVTAVIPTTIGGIIVTESALAVLGIGVQPPATSWGVLLSKGTEWAGGGYVYLFAWPLAMLILTVFAFATFGDALRDALDPKLR